MSTQDIHSSLLSGRLLKQITIMSKHYSQPILLIEFDESIQFKLKDRYDSNHDTKNVDGSSVFSKITLLQLNFPTLTILWSKNPKETVKIFEKLKRKCKNPDLDKLDQLIVPDKLTGDLDEEEYNARYSKSSRGNPCRRETRRYKCEE